jgi:hypothetical protein
MRTRHIVAALLLLWGVLAGCATNDTPSLPATTQTPLPTLETSILQRSRTTLSESYLRVTLPRISLADTSRPVQLFVIIADPTGSYTYLVYPANQAGDDSAAFEMSQFPLELSINAATESATIWILAVHNTRYIAAEKLGLDPLANALAKGFRDWLAGGGSNDDPLAAVVSASDGMLYEWFASIEVIGQITRPFYAQEGWDITIDSLRSPDSNLTAVYSVQYVVPQLPPPPTATATTDGIS